MNLVILDRDGVINEDSDSYIKTVDEWIPIDGSIDAIARLSKAGFTIAIATNQSGLSRNFFSVDELTAMHEKMLRLVAKAEGEIAGIFYCPHHPDDNCNCRKPKAGLIDIIEQNLSVSAENAFIIGDSLRDLQAGLEKKCVPLLVKTGKGEKTLAQLKNNPHPGLSNLAVFDNLADAATYIIDQA
jgi:D-glycero-D-manno-heptose 1,7-bisphosphate phosphatase